MTGVLWSKKSPKSPGQKVISDSDLKRELLFFCQKDSFFRSPGYNWTSVINNRGQNHITDEIRDIIRLSQNPSVKQPSCIVVRDWRLQIGDFRVADQHSCRINLQSDLLLPHFKCAV